MDNEERKLESEWYFCQGLMKDVNWIDNSKEKWEKLKDGYLQGKVSYETWERYFKENPLDIDEEIKNSDELIKEYLMRKDLFNFITEKELDKKIVREYGTRKSIFLCAAGGRLVENCQIASYNLLINDEAGTGKDYITGKTLEILPKDIYIKKTRISPTVFTYWHNSNYEPEWTWDGKVFYTEDISEGVLNSEVFKVMCSSGSEATVVIRQRAIDIDIIGKPVMITTTATATPSPELTRRFEIVNLNESLNQTKEIMKRHCEYAIKGITPEYDPKITEALSLLKRVKIKIPYALKLHSLFPANSLMMRTKFPRFLDFIKASAAFHQFQRKVDEEGYLLAEGQDYDIATEVMKKLTSNKYLISLTRNQRRIVEYLEKVVEIDSEYSESASKIREQMNNFMSLPAMQTNLSIMSGYGILKVKLEEGVNNREVEKFTLNNNILEKDSLIFPSFEVLIGEVPQEMGQSKVSKVSKVSKAIKAIKEK